ncbi:hypothetical protein GLOIN_2v1762049 [Rhizophagus clarus]|nr:hypothetical protein GLOIN_2v1762049 [Rhizophagus clarus]
MDEDIITGAAVDVEVDGFSSSFKENNIASTFPSSPPNIAVALSAPNNNVSGSLDAFMHARMMTPASPPNVSSDKATADNSPVDQLPIQTPTFSIKRNDYQAAATPNSAPETLKISPQIRH